MSQTFPLRDDAGLSHPSASSPLTQVEQSVAQLGTLLGDLEPALLPLDQFSSVYENRLIEVRLGIASSLFAALKQKHAPTAAHSLRVALGCSSWAFAMGLDDAERDVLEVAALLHDIGKIGAPDRLLLKPGALALDESQLMDQYRLAGLEILANCCPSQAIVEIIRNSAGWYDGSRPNYPLVAKEIPAGARMLAIVDAFDSMTTDQVYRPAMSRERALHELFSFAGTQFDPELIKCFGDLQITAQMHRKVIGHWLHQLDPLHSNRFWRNLTAVSVPGVNPPGEELFQRKLLDNMYDAVVFIDRNMQIIQWNRGAERLTGITAASVLHRTWSPKLIGMRDMNSGAFEEFECPVAYCMNSGVQSLRRLLVACRTKRAIAVDVHTVPVAASDGTNCGAAMLLHDASPEATLEEQCQNLYEKATRDPLTQVANRAEFDSALQQFVTAHLERRLPCSLIMCDIDHFKSINDTYGHQAGDVVLRFFGQLLKSECRTGDLVARYGGEEFVLLCADCNNATAAQRAEQLRQSVGALPQPAMNGNVVTVSFGVTEIQPGDTPESMLRRADRALLEAKRMGRNIVVQLGDGLGDYCDASGHDALAREAGSNELVLEAALVTAVPLAIAIEKLRGFITDHHAEILSINADRVELQLENRRKRRRSDRPLPLVVELAFSEQHVSAGTLEGRSLGKLLRTRVAVGIRLKRSRDRRHSHVSRQAAQVLAAIQSYLMASPETTPAEHGTARRAANLLAPWLKARGRS